jgi:pimeloyl-ACP methyl ester carboxylesterase
MMAAITRGFCALVVLGLVVGGVTLPGGWLQSSVVVLVAVLTLKFVVTSTNFLLAARANRTDPVGFAVPPLRIAYGFIEEAWHAMLGALVRLPWLVAAPLAVPHAPRAKRWPLLMIHGFVCNRGFWVPAAQQLIAQGYTVDAITLEPAFGSIDDYPVLIADAIAALKVKSGAERVVLVCHSMGGLAARAYLRDYGTAHVAHVITVGTPHHGTALAKFALSQNAAQMRCNGPWLRALEATEPADAFAQFTTLYSRIDNIVAPARTAVLPGAKEVELNDVGHVALGYAPRALHALFAEVDRVTQHA